MVFDYANLSVIGIGIIRSVAGWLENVLEDGKISSYEYAQLGATIFRTALLSLGLIFGLDLEPLAASGSAFVIDFIVSKLSKK